MILVHVCEMFTVYSSNLVAEVLCDDLSQEVMKFFNDCQWLFFFKLNRTDLDTSLNFWSKLKYSFCWEKMHMW